MNMNEELAKFGLTEKTYEECLRMITDKKNGVNDMDWQEICDQYHLNMSVETLRKSNSGIFGGAFVSEYYQNKNEAKPVQLTQEEHASETTYNKDGSFSSKRLIAMSEKDLKDPSFILNAHGFDPDHWKLVSAKNNIRQAISSADGAVTLYASFITVQPLDENTLTLSKIEEFFQRLDRHYSLPMLSANHDYLDGDKMLLIDIADLHLNLQASMMTTGNEYNCDIAEKLFFHVIEDVLARTANYKFKEILFVVGGDMLNGDNLQGSTTKGTPQNSDMHYYDAYERLCAMTIKAIDILKDRSRVNVIYCAGNHDEVTGFKLAKYIDAWFRYDENVVVDYKPYPRKYKMFGKTLLCFAHDGKAKNLPMLIADEAREYWSSADTVEVFLQHMHTEQVLMEDNNIRIQRLPTISAKSKWSVDQGYSSKRQCKSFVFDMEDGLTDVLYTPIKKVK